VNATATQPPAYSARNTAPDRCTRYDAGAHAPSRCQRCNGALAPRTAYFRHEQGSAKGLVCGTCHGPDACTPAAATVLPADAYRAGVEAARAEIAAAPAPVPPTRDSGLDDHHPLITALAPERIRPSPRNPRRFVDEADLAELVASVRAHGVLEPVLVRPRTPDAAGETYELIAGERRWRAAILAERPRIPARILEGLSDAEALHLTLVENLQRKDLDPIEEAEGYRALGTLGLKQAAIAAAVHRTQPSIANRLRLLKLPEDVQERVRCGELSPSHGEALAQYADFPAVASRVAELALEQRWTSKRLEEGLGYDAWRLEEQGLLRNLGRYETAFDVAQCDACPFGAKRKGGSGGAGVCLKPDHYDELQAAAVAERQAAVSRRVEEARAAGTELPRLEELPRESYRSVWDSNRPAGCSEACPCFARALSADDREIPICTDPPRLEQLRRAAAKADTQARRDQAKTLRADALARIDALEAISARELAPLVASALGRIMGGRAPVDSALRHAEGRIALEKGQQLWGFAERYRDLSALEPLALVKLGLEAMLLADVAGLTDTYQRRAPLAAWYLELDSDGEALDAAAADEEEA
jgi:ParB family chromosome partitioning protein